MEELLVPIMYDLPDRENVAEVIVDDAVARGEGEPTFVEAEEKRSA